MTHEQLTSIAIQGGCEHSDGLAPWTCPICLPVKVLSAIRAAVAEEREQVTSQIELMGCLGHWRGCGDKIHGSLCPQSIAATIREQQP